MDEKLREERSSQVNIFKTWVLEEHTKGGTRLEKLPFCETKCIKCKFVNVCRAASERLPLVVREPCIPTKTYHCDIMDIDLQMCMVVSVKRKVTMPLEQHKGVEDTVLYLLDANIFLNAYTCHPDLGEVCAWVLNDFKMRIATTDKVLQNELFDTHGHDLPSRLEVIKVTNLDKWVRELKPAEGLKELSDVDRSLIQAAMTSPRCKGIITFDPDFDNCAVGGLLTSRTGRKIDVMNAFELKRKVLK